MIEGTQETYIPYFDEWVDIDFPIVNLVQALNEIPGVCTLNSCGGHHEQIYFDQAPESSFYINFAVEHNAKGWRALDKIVSVLGNDGRKLSVNVSDVDGASFSIDGDGSITANEVAYRLRANTPNERR